MFEYILRKKLIALEDRIEINAELINYYNNLIEESETIISDSVKMINSYIAENEQLKKTMEDIYKIK
jgi:hypothetical protein